MRDKEPIANGVILCIDILIASVNLLRTGPSLRPSFAQALPSAVTKASISSINKSTKAVEDRPTGYLNWPARPCRLRIVIQASVIVPPAAPWLPHREQDVVRHDDLGIGANEHCGAI